MARALELVRSKAWPGLIDRFSNWAKAVTLPQMEYYYDVLTKQQQIPNHFGNWHATIAEAMMAVGVLANDRGRYNKGVVIFHDTVKHYLKVRECMYDHQCRCLAVKDIILCCNST